jgi:hypothetical protein
MKVSQTAVLAVATLILGQLRVAAIDVDFSDADIRRAVAVAISSDAVRERFHAQYILPISDPVIERMEIVTELRRYVMASEEQLALGNWMLARGGFDSKGRTLKQLLEQWKGQVSIRVRVRFHPFHAYAAVPPIDILVGEPSFIPLDVVRTPVETSGDAGRTLVGGEIDATFNAPSFLDRTLPVRVMLEGKELIRKTVDFSMLE